MKYSILLIFIFLFTAASYSQNNHGTLSIEGVVVDKNDSIPIPDVEVTLKLTYKGNEETGIKETKTGQDGTFKFSLDSLNKLKDDLTIELVHSDYNKKSITVSEDFSKVKADTTIDLGKIELEGKTGKYLGKIVIDEQDNIEQTEVKFSEQNTPLKVRPDGTFETPEVEIGSYALSIKHKFYETIDTTIKITTNENKLDTFNLKVKPVQLRISLNLSDETKGNISEINISSNNTPLTNKTWQGDTLITEIPRGENHILGTLNYFIPDDTTIQAVPGMSYDISLNLEFKKWVIKGIVKLDSDTANTVENTVIKVDNYQYNNEINGPDSNGIYYIPFVEPNLTYSINAELDNYAPGSIDVTVNESSDTTKADPITLNYYRGMIEGKVSFKDEYKKGNLNQAEVILETMDGVIFDTSTLSNTNTYQIKFIPEGDYWIYAKLDEFKENKKRISIPKHSEIDFELEYDFGEMSISVIDYYNKNSDIDSAKIYIKGEINDTVLFTNSLGEADIDSLYQEKVDIEIKKEGYIDWIYEDYEIIGGDNSHAPFKLKKIPKIELYNLESDSITIIEEISFTRPEIVGNEGKKYKEFKIRARYLVQDVTVNVDDGFLVSKNQTNNYSSSTNINVSENQSVKDTSITLYVKIKPQVTEEYEGSLIVSTDYRNSNNPEERIISLSGRGLSPMRIDQIIETYDKDRNDLLVCKGTSISLEAKVSGGEEGTYSYKWGNTGYSVKDSYISNPVNKKTAIKLTVKDEWENEIEETIEIDLYTLPDSAELDIIVKGGQQEGAFLYVAGYNFDKYTWYGDTSIVQDDTIQYYYPGSDALGEYDNYFVEVTDSFTCKFESNPMPSDTLKSLLLKSSLIQNKRLHNGFVAYPNPTFDKVYIYGKDFTAYEVVNAVVYNGLGNVLDNIKLKGQNFYSPFEIDLANYPPGIYYIKLSSGNLTVTKKVLLK